MKKPNNFTELPIDFILGDQRGKSGQYKLGTSNSIKLQDLIDNKYKVLAERAGFVDKSQRFLKSLLSTQAPQRLVPQFRYVDKLLKQQEQGKLNLERRLRNQAVFKANRAFTDAKGDDFVHFVIFKNENRFNYEEHKDLLRELSAAGESTNKWVEENRYTEEEQLNFKAGRLAKDIPLGSTLEEYRELIKDDIKTQGDQYGRLELNKRALKKIDQAILNKNLPWF